MISRKWFNGWRRRLAALSLIVSALCGGLGAAARAQTPTEAVAVTLQPGDMLTVEIWREEDLGGEFLVDEDGVVTLPMLGAQQVTDVPLAALRDTLLAQYRVQLRNPSINIIPLRRINVLGEVREPGMYKVDPTVSLASAIAMAGGTTPAGDLDRIRVIRGSDVIRERVGPEATLSTIDIRSGDHIIVEPRAWIERNSTFLISVALSVPTAIAGLIGLLNLMK